MDTGKVANVGKRSKQCQFKHIYENPQPKRAVNKKKSAAVNQNKYIDSKHAENTETMQNQNTHKPRKQMQQKNAANPTQVLQASTGSARWNSFDKRERVTRECVCFWSGRNRRVKMQDLAHNVVASKLL